MKRSCRYLFTLILFLLCMTIPSSAIAAEQYIGKRRAELIKVSNKEASWESGIYIIRLADPPLALYRGGIRNFAPTTTAGVRKLNIDSRSASAYRQYLDGKQSIVRQVMERTLVRPVSSRFRYNVVFNGMAVELTRAEAEKVKLLPGVISVEPEKMSFLHTDAGPQWIGADQLWDDAAFCNDKLIGAYDCTPEVAGNPKTALDVNGHGSGQQCC